MRDELLGLHPSDYDIATDASPDRIRVLFPRASFVGAAFGVVLVTQHSHTIEVATFRSDGPYSDRRRPDTVTFSDPKADAQRRDFTVNALFLDPQEPPDETDRSLGIAGHLIDFVGGVADLRARVIRAVGDPEARLAEDHLRALRAVRFAARLDFGIESETADAIRRHASDLVGVSHERIGEELRRIMAHSSRMKGMSLLAHLELDSPVFNEPTHRGPWDTLERIQASAPSFAHTLAALAVDRHGGQLKPEPLTRRWRSALMLSNVERDALLEQLNLAFDIRDRWRLASIAQRKRWASHPHFAESMILIGHNSDLVESIHNDVTSLSQTSGGLSPVPLVDGQALIAEGITPGPSFGTILHELYDRQLEGQITTRDEAIRQARELSDQKSV